MENIQLIVLMCYCVLVMGVMQSNGQFFGTSTRCTNPNGRAGFCEPIQKCRTLVSVLTRQPLRDEDRKFLRASSCTNSYGKKPYVCCTWDTEFKTTRRHEVKSFWQSPTTQRYNFKEEQQQQLRASFGRSNALPSPPTCGGVTITNKILGGSDADLYEFPWMALLEYSKNGGISSSNCAGSLINQRYVLTAAHCVKGPIEAVVGKLVAVRLGEHDITNSIDSEAIRVGIEEVSAHTSYNSKSSDLSNDIALIRLQRNVEYTNAIRPICLPGVISASEPRAGTEFTVAGWGTTLHNARATVKQKLNVNLVSLEQCQRKFSERHIQIGSNQLCAGSEFSEDSCEGDSGGPLMRLYGAAWVLDGVVSFGYKCGLADWPGVYTRVSNFDSWIRSHMRA